MSRSRKGSKHRYSEIWSKRADGRFTGWPHGPVVKHYTNRAERARKRRDVERHQREHDSE